MISIALCNDCSIYNHDTVKSIVLSTQKITGINIHVTDFTNTMQLVECYKQDERFDIIVIDIDNPETNVNENIQKLRRMDSAFFLVILSSCHTEIFNVIPYRINAFIFKDSDKTFFVSELVRVINEYESVKPSSELFCILDNGKRHTIKVLSNDILFFYCENKIAFMVTKNNKLQLVSKITEIENKYLDKNFFKICRGYIVNLAKIKLVKKNDIVLDNDVCLPLSRGSEKVLLKKLSEFLGEEHPDTIEKS